MAAKGLIMVGLQGASERVVATADPHRIASWNRLTLVGLALSTIWRRQRIFAASIEPSHADHSVPWWLAIVVSMSCTNGCVLLFDAEAVF